MKQDYTFSFLRPHDRSELRETFLKAFADYLLPIQLSAEQFDAKIKREGIVPSFCVAAYAGEEMAGFILTGLGEWQGKPTAYNGGTGVLPAHRGKRLTKLLYQFLFPKLQESGVEQCLLEVIQENKPALDIYKSLGFKVTRALDCFRCVKDNLILNAATPTDIVISEAVKPDWNAYLAICKLTPSWQNSSIAFKQFPGDKLVLEARNEQAEVVGFIAFTTANGSVSHLAVHPDFREQGVGTALLREAVHKTTNGALLFNNIDTEATDFIAFLKRRHFKIVISQYEMLMPVVSVDLQHK